MTIIEVKAKPNSPKPGLSRLANGTVLARVAAVPEQGKANEAIRRLLADSLGISRGDVQLKTGATSGQKLFEVDLSADAVATWLAALPPAKG